MKVFNSVFKRKPLFPILISLLLLLAVSLTVIGAAMLSLAEKQRTAIDGEYVTIAVFPDRRSYTWEERKNGTAKEDDNIHPYSAQETALNSGFVQDVDYRYILGAQVKGSKAITSGYKDVLDYDADFDEPCYNMAVFAVKCVKSELLDIEWPEAEEDAPVVGLGETYYSVEAEIMDVVSLAQSYPDIYDDTGLIKTVETERGFDYVPATVPTPARIEIMETLFTSEGEIPFREGHTYLIYGFYRDYPTETFRTFTEARRGRDLSYGRHFLFTDVTRQFVHSDRYGDITVPQNADADTIANILNEQHDRALEIKRDYMDDGRMYYYPNEQMLPRWAEYSGSWEDFLESEEGRVWREEIIPLCKINQSSATVMLTDNVRSLYAFNTGAAALTEGRFFDGFDYAGKRVCMISAAYARHNGYKLGDKLALDFYNTGFWGSETIARGPCLYEDRLNITEEYEIVGIYSAPEFSRGVQLFCADTIFVPKKSVPLGEDFEQNHLGNRSMTSLILKNGTKDSFLEYMEQNGQKGAYLCFDQNFSAAEISLDALIQNGRMLLWVGIAAFIITAALAHFLTMRRFAPSAKTMRLLGIERKTVARQAFGAFLLIDAVAAILGAGLAAALFSTVTEKAVSTALSPDHTVIAACAAAAFLLPALLSMLCAKVLSEMPLMQNERKGRDRK